MRNLFKFLLVIALIMPFTSYAGGGGHGGGHGGGGGEKVEVPKKMKGSFSEEDMEQMRLYQHIQNIASPRYPVSEYATFFFEQRGAKYVPALLKHLKRYDDDDKTVSAVLYTFGRIGPDAARAVPIITQYLNYENPEIRKTAMASLGKIGKASDPAVPEIAKFLSSEDEWTRTLALRSLKSINTQQAKAIASVYEKKIKLEEERKNQALLEEGAGVAATDAALPSAPAETTTTGETLPIEKKEEK